MRLAVINLVPTPYREPLYNTLSRTPGLTLRVFYLQPSDSVRGWSRLTSSYDSVTLRSLSPEWLYPVPLVGGVNPGLTGRLLEFAPDCLFVHGYSYWTQMQAMRWAIRRGVPYFLLGDSNASKLHRRGPAAALKATLLGHFCRRAAGALAIGSANEQFWLYYGVPPDRLYRSPLAVDNNWFARQAATVRGQKQLNRRRLGLPEGRLLLFVGRFAPEKNLPELLLALDACRRNGAPPLALALVGDGPEKPVLDRLLRRVALPGVVQFGFQNQAELAAFYGVSDALILPSRRDAWGLVVNEAMAAGLPVLLSRSVGCLPDLLEEGANGFSFDAGKVSSIAACLGDFARLSDERLAAMGRRSAELIRDWSLSAALAGIHQALDSVSPRFAAPATAAAAMS